MFNRSGVLTASCFGLISSAPPFQSDVERAPAAVAAVGF